MKRTLLVGSAVLAVIGGKSASAQMPQVLPPTPTQIALVSPTQTAAPTTATPLPTAAPTAMALTQMTAPAAVAQATPVQMSTQASPSITLALTTPTQTAAPNTNITITLTLTDTGDTAGGPGSDLSSFDTNIGLDTTYLSFVGGFSPNAASPFTFNDNPSGSTAGNLRAAYDANSGPDANITNGRPLTLGSFVVHVGSNGLPSGGTYITLGPPQVTLSNGGSEVFNGTTGGDVLTNVTPVKLSPAPEPSPLAAFSLGMAGLGLLAWRKRRQPA